MDVVTAPNVPYHEQPSRHGLSRLTTLEKCHSIISVSAAKEQQGTELMLCVPCCASNKTSRWHIQNKMNDLNDSLFCEALALEKIMHVRKQLHCVVEGKQQTPSKSFKTKFLPQNVPKPQGGGDGALRKWHLISSGTGWDRQGTGLVLLGRLSPSPQFITCFLSAGFLVKNIRFMFTNITVLHLQALQLQQINTIPS